MPKVTSNSSVGTTEIDLDGASYYGQETTNSILNRVFHSCSDDPKSSIHRAWGLTLILLVVFFIMSIVEMMNLKSAAGSRALVMASMFTGIVHLILGILGTFVLKRFPTSFSIGFFLGVSVILANQNFILTGTFFGYAHGNPQTNRMFANLGFGLFLALTSFSLMLYHFRGDIVVAPVESKRVHHHPHHHHSPPPPQHPHSSIKQSSQPPSRQDLHNNHAIADDASQLDHATDYSQYTEDQA